MKKLLLICIMAVAATMAKAQSTMIVQNSNDDSKKTGIKLDEVQKLTFANDKVVVSKNNGAADKTFDLNAFNKITFDNSEVGIAGVKVEKSGLQFDYDGESISVKGLTKAVPVVVYNATGAVVESKKEWNGSKLSVAGLPEGMYLLSVEGVPYKFLKK